MFVVLGLLFWVRGALLFCSDLHTRPNMPPVFVIARFVPLPPDNQAHYNRARDLVRNLTGLGVSMNDFDVICRFVVMEEGDEGYQKTYGQCERIVEGIRGARRARRQGKRAVCKWLEDFFADVAQRDLVTDDLIWRFQLLRACRPFTTPPPFEDGSDYAAAETYFLLSEFGRGAARRVLKLMDADANICVRAFTARLCFGEIPEKIRHYKKAVLIPVYSRDPLHELSASVQNDVSRVFNLSDEIVPVGAWEAPIYIGCDCCVENLMDARIFHVLFAEAIGDPLCMDRLHKHLVRRYQSLCKKVAKFCVLRAILEGGASACGSVVDLFSSALACRQMLGIVRDFRRMVILSRWRRSL